MLRTHQVKVALVTALLVLSALLPVAAGAAPGTKRIEVNLTRQWLYAYQGNRLVLSSVSRPAATAGAPPPGTLRSSARCP
jgi:hypothetical protein